MDKISLAVALKELKKGVRKYCKEKNFDPYSTKFTVRIFENLVSIFQAGQIEGLKELIQVTKEGIREIDDRETMIISINEDSGLSFSERRKAEEYLNEKNNHNRKKEKETGIERLKEKHNDGSRRFAELLVADAHVRIGLFNRDYGKIFMADKAAEQNHNPKREEIVEKALSDFLRAANTFCLRRNYNPENAEFDLIVHPTFYLCWTHKIQGVQSLEKTVSEEIHHLDKESTLFDESIGAIYLGDSIKNKEEEIMTHCGIHLFRRWGIWYCSFD
jgi:hypothetical protein